MTTSIDPEFIRTQLLTGSYPDGTLNEFNIFDFEQVTRRRRYPSAEIVYIPESLSEDRKQTDKTLGFEIRYYDKIVGGRTEQLVILKEVEDVIIGIIDGTTLEDPNILLQTFQWTRQHVQRDKDHPEYNVSILKIFVKTRLEAGQVNDAVLTFVKNNSEVLTPPAGDYTYSQIFDTEYYEGYRTHEEQITKHPDGVGIPYYYRGGFQAPFITHIHVKAIDIGTTGDKANNLNVLLSNGEKPTFGFTWKKNTDDSPTKHVITQSGFIEIDRVEYAYTWDDIVVFRVFGHGTKPASMSTT